VIGAALARMRETLRGTDGPALAASALENLLPSRS
jgi:hypothetical protein